MSVRIQNDCAHQHNCKSPVCDVSRCKKFMVAKPEEKVMKNDGVPILGSPSFSISLRDYFAGIALQSLIVTSFAEISLQPLRVISKDVLMSYEDLTQEAYKYANCMLLEKKKQDVCDDN